MFRTILLSALAAATLAGCATDYSYRNGGGGDYYYGQPRIEYRYYGPQGFYGSYGYGSYGYGGYAGYYHDRYGRLVYGNPYYGYPYRYGGQWWYRPRPPHGHDGDHHDDDHDDDRDDRRPPWRNIGGVLPPGERVAPDRDDPRPRMRRQQAPSAMPMPSPQRERRSIAPPPPRMRSDDGGGSRMGRVIRNAKASSSSDE